jgi:hypothetical protein
MGILIFIAVTAGIGYFVYNSLPATKFTKANELLTAGNLELALQKFYEIKEKHNEAGVKIAEIKFQIAESLINDRNNTEALKELQTVLEVRKGIYLNTINMPAFTAIETKARKVIYDIHYKEAVSLFNKGQINLALTNLENLKGKHSKADVKIAEVRLYIAEQALKSNKLDDDDVLLLFSNVLDVQKGMKSSFSKENSKRFKELEQKAIEAITNIHYQKGQSFLKETKLDLAVDSFNAALKWCNDKMQNTKANCIAALIKIDYKKGTINEQKRNTKKAIVDYKNALGHFLENQKNTLFYDIQARIEICKLKENITPTKRNLTRLAGKNISSKNELMFRYAVHFAKKNEIEACEKILDDYFITNNSIEITQLRTFCKEYYQRKALMKIDLVNKVVFKNISEETTQLYNDFDNISITIKKGFPELSKKVDKFKPYLFSRLISEYFENEAFEEIITHITSFEKFYEEPELLKNIGIACLRIANNQQITSANYQNIISTWLTTVYSDRVILNSLEVTDWDDDYTFTLLNSIGSEYAFENDVENVNFDEVSSNNICIGETQRQLVSYFEAALNEISNADLSKKIQMFYNTEKEAIEKIITTISTEIIYAAPSFAKEHNLQDTILKHLVAEFKESEDISILEIGLLYTKGKQPTVFENYQIAKKFVSNVLHAIKNRRSIALGNQNTSSNKNALAQFPKISENFEGQMNMEFHSIMQEEESIATITLFEKGIEISSNKEQLKSKCSDFITNLVISRVNDGNMNNETSLLYLVKAYELNKNNHRISNNLATIVRFNCSDMLNNDISNAAREKLERLARIKNGLLTQSLKNELVEVFNTIMTQIRQNEEEVIKLFEKEIGIRKTRDFGIDDYELTLKISIFEAKRTNKHDFNPFGPSLSREGLQLAAKLKIIYNLI